MRYCGFLLILGCFLASPTAAQEIAKGKFQTRDLAGVWRISGKQPSDQLERTLFISFSEGEVKLSENIRFATHLFANDLSLYIDGRGETNNLNIGGFEQTLTVISKTHWKNEKLVRTAQYSTRAGTPSAQFIVVHKETTTYKLSSDRNSLTVNILSIRENPSADGTDVRSSKLVYVRKL